ncbi:hypothetical protein HELRODRAFT_74016, partial [Helobdella robusta]|uniref:Protein kinase domain-containing protein n=1 Tax=Helobdella robusta TaxID=6412 RepID=T1G1L2_HELRO
MRSGGGSGNNCRNKTSSISRNSWLVRQQLDIGRGDEKICYLADLTDRFNIIRKIGSGTFGSVFLALRLNDQKKVALKKLAKDKTKIEDFCIEFRYGRLFSRHPGVLETFSTAYVTNAWFVLVHEYAPMSDLLRLVPPRVGLPEVAVKSVMRQLVGAVQYVHEAGVVHRDLKLENILVFQNVTRVKLGDFGVARKVGTKVCKVCEGTTYTPPEICFLTRHSHYKVLKSADVWSAGVLVFCLMTGSFPWQQADINRDPLFQSFARWQSKKSATVPEHWKRFSPSLQKLFHRFLDPRPEKRPEVSSLSRYLNSRW